MALRVNRKALQFQAMRIKKAGQGVLAIFWIALCSGQSTAPNISNVTNAAYPALDYPPASLTVSPRSLLTIFGENLADSIATASAPWPEALSGTEVHLASDTCFDASCDLIGGMVYASPTQVNFALPSTPYDVPPTSYRIVLVRDGQRIDNRGYIAGGPGRLTIDGYSGDLDVVFQIGYDCLYS